MIETFIYDNIYIIYKNKKIKKIKKRVMKKMIMKIIVCKEDKQEEVFTISNYYTECENYLEADINGEREIIINGQNCMELEDQWEELSIYTDNMIEILKFAVPEKEA